MVADDIVDTQPRPSQRVQLVTEDQLILIHSPIDESQVAIHLLDQGSNRRNSDPCGDEDCPGVASGSARERAKGSFRNHPSPRLDAGQAGGEVAQSLDGDA